MTSRDRHIVNVHLRDVVLPHLEGLETETLQERDAEIARLRECLRGMAEQLADLAALTTDAEQLEAALESVVAVGDADLTRHYRATERGSRLAQMHEEQRQRAEKDNAGKRGAA